MIYTELTKKAMKLAYKAHCGQVDKSGVPYIFHPIHVAEQMNTEAETCAALLHDVCEDTSITIGDIAQMGFPTEVIDAIRLLTHSKTTPYMEYVKLIGKNPVAKAVKLADLKHNADLSRLNNITEKDIARIQKYKDAIAFLMQSE